MKRITNYESRKDWVANNIAKKNSDIKRLTARISRQYHNMSWTTDDTKQVIIRCGVIGSVTSQFLRIKLIDKSKPLTIENCFVVYMGQDLHPIHPKIPIGGTSDSMDFSASTICPSK
jgi:hypothetical protein